MQNFNNDVGQVIQTQTLTQITHQEFKLLSKDERRELHNKVKLLEQKFQRKSSSTWVLLHQTCGVSKVDEMHEYHFSPLNKILDLLHEQSELEMKLSNDFSNQRIIELTKKNQKIMSVMICSCILSAVLAFIVVWMTIAS